MARKTCVLQVAAAAKLARNKDLASYGCEDCRNTTMVQASLDKPFCVHCGSAKLVASEHSSTHRARSLMQAPEEELSNVRCPGCSSHLIMTTASAVALSDGGIGHLHCPACSAEVAYQAPETAAKAAKTSTSDSDPGDSSDNSDSSDADDQDSSADWSDADDTTGGSDDSGTDAGTADPGSADPDDSGPGPMVTVTNEAGDTIGQGTLEDRDDLIFTLDVDSTDDIVLQVYTVGSSDDVITNDDGSVTLQNAELVEQLSQEELDDATGEDDDGSDAGPDDDSGGGDDGSDETETSALIAAQPEVAAAAYTKDQLQAFAATKTAAPFRKAGFTAAVNGKKKADNPHPRNSGAHHAWSMGHAKGKFALSEMASTEGTPDVNAKTAAEIAAEAAAGDKPADATAPTAEETAAVEAEATRVAAEAEAARVESERAASEQAPVLTAETVTVPVHQLAQTAGVDPEFALLGDTTVCRIGNVVVATRMDGREVAAFSDAMNTALRRGNSLGDLLQQNAFTVAQVTVNAEVARSETDRLAQAETAAAHATQMEHVGDTLRQSLGIALTGLNRGFFRQSDPLRERLTANLISAGGDADTVHELVAASFADAGDDFANVVRELAMTAFNRSDEVRNELAATIMEVKPAVETARVRNADPLEDSLTRPTRQADREFARFDTDTRPPRDKSRVRELAGPGGRLF